ncbi:unnamed protein product [Sphagnum jensenii]
MQTSPPLSVRPFITAWPAPSTPQSGGTKLIPLTQVAQAQAPDHDTAGDADSIQAVELPPLAGPPSVMNVIVVAAECAPWSKTGGLGDVVGSLPKALSCHSHNIMVVAPQYTNYADARETGIWKIYNVSGQDMEVGYFHTFEDGVDFVFINSSIFHAVASNNYGGSHEVACHIPCRGVCYGDSNLVFIASDWHPALLPVYLQVYYQDNGLMEFMHSILVIHNMAPQSGILSWIPALRVMTTITYSLDTLPLGKSASKAVLQREPGLPVCNEVPLIGFIQHLDYQKGMDWLAGAMPWMMDQDLQLVMLGTGCKDLEDMLHHFEGCYFDKLCGWVGLSVRTAHHITAGADILLMPSCFEPCGLNQLYAMRYGTVQVVHSVGGLQEIVQPLDPFTASGMGWTFDRAEVSGFTDALKNAMWTYCDFKNNLDWHKGSTECHRIRAGTMQLSSMRKCYMAAKYSQ